MKKGIASVLAILAVLGLAGCSTPRFAEEPRTASEGSVVFRVHAQDINSLSRLVVWEADTRRDGWVKVNSAVNALSQEKLGTRTSRSYISPLGLLKC